MYLSRLEIVGFKSFARKHSFDFKGGLTAIVGPNGCGKTNVVDAIRWVLGEQKTAVLRSEVMENVIFNGTAGRKPLGMAEVSLTLLNNKNVLPTEYSEVTISRRLFRNGDSHYLINNTQCRLRDIVDMFMDTGLGSDSYSVIELKMIEAILSGKPEERRQLFEEAAGVKKYKQRRKEASRKLANVQNDLTRLDDIVTEVRKNVNSLSRQAAKTRRYNKLFEQVRDLEMASLRNEYAMLRQYADTKNADITEAHRRQIKAEIELSKHENHISKLKEELARVEEKHSAVIEEENSINAELANKSKQLALDEQKAESLATAEERLVEQQEEATQHNERARRKLSETSGAISQLKMQREEQSKNAAVTREVSLSAAAEVESLRAEAAGIKEQIISLQNQKANLNAAIDKGAKRREMLQQNLKRAVDETNSIQQKIADIEAQSKEKTEARKELEDRRKTAEEELALAQENQLSLQGAIDDLRNRIAESRSMLSNRKGNLEFLSNLFDADETVKFLLKSDKWQPASEKLLLAEAIGADEKYRVAIDAALGTYASMYITDSDEEAEVAAKLLKENDKGKCSFLVRSRVPETKAPAALGQTENVFGRLSEIVRVNDKLRNALRLMLGDMAIVSDIETARKLIDKGDAESCISISGELLTRSGILRSGSQLKNEGLTVGKQERMQAIRVDIEAITEEIEELEETLKSARTEYDAIDIPELTRKVRLTESQINENETNISRAAMNIQSLQQNIGMINRNRDLYTGEIEEIDREAESAERDIEQLANQLNKVNEQSASMLDELSIAEERLKAAEAEKVESDMALVRISAELKNAESDEQRFSAQIKSSQHRREQAASDIKNNKIIIEKLLDNADRLRREIKDIQDSAADTRSRREYLSADIRKNKEQVNQYSDDIVIYRKDYEKVKEEIHQLELKLSEFKSRINSIMERAREGYEIELQEETNEYDPDFDLNTTKDELAEVKEKLGKIGNVNFMALEEYETQSERLKFYEEQISDLKEAETNLLTTIEEINITAKQKFRDTFDIVHNNFRDLFQTLFNSEAYAELKMAEGDPLEADIEIIARPPGKKPHSIEQLSGGEKTLTAIALLFAIYLVKPAPFCILDEVDAPLDDANIGRFLSLIRRFSNNTQFLIVTHNKKTMAAADTMYGITMQETGVSTIVSVRLASS